MKRLLKYGFINQRVEIELISLTESQRFELFNLFFEAYYNTDQDICSFASEFYHVVDKLRKNIIPLHLEKLKVEEIYDKIIDILEGKTCIAK